MAWRAIDVSTSGGWIAAATVHPWQLRWYVSLLGGPKSFRGSASVTKGGVKLAVTARWPREREDKILRESRWLESVLGCAVRGWRELVDAINWRWVLKKVEELVDELKPLMGSKKMDNAEREWLARRMLSELALLAHFAEARRGMDADKWREERIKRLAEAVKALSNGRIGGDNADSLALTIIRYAEGYKKETEERIKNIAEKVGLSREELWGVVKRVFSGENPYAYYLARYCAWDAVVRKFVEPALELIMLDKALRGEFSREMALFIFGDIRHGSCERRHSGDAECHADRRWGAGRRSRTAMPCHTASAQPAPARQAEVWRTDVREEGRLQHNSKRRERGEV